MTQPVSRHSAAVGADAPRHPAAIMPAQLEHLAHLARALEAHPQRQDALALAARVAAHQFYVACLGQFKRGKSTLIDALLGDTVLPRGVVPVTTVPTVVRYGVRRSARVRNAASGDGARDEWQEIGVEEIAHYVSEEHNPSNAKRVLAVEVFVPSALLASGMCLVDTPGIGSVHAANSQATKAFLPQVDAAIVVLGADPPLAGEELDLVAEVAADVQHLILVLNKADRVSAEERLAAGVFAQQAIEARIGRPAGPLLEVSATEMLAGEGSGRDWPRLVAHLQDLGMRAGRELAADAGRRGVARVSSQLLGLAAARREAIESPLEARTRWMASLEHAIALATRALEDLSVLFAAEQTRLLRRFADERRQFIGTAATPAHDSLSLRLRSIHGHWGPVLRRRMMHAAQDVARETLGAWLTPQQALADAAFETSMARFTTDVESLFQRLAESGARELDALGIGANLDRHLSTPSRFFFHDVIRVAEPASPLRYLLDAALGLVPYRRPFERDAHGLLDWLLEVNSSRVEHDVRERIATGRQELEARVHSALQDAADRAEQVLTHAEAVRREGAAAVRAELDRLRALEGRITAVAHGAPADTDRWTPPTEQA